jgi:hypothetical protein
MLLVLFDRKALLLSDCTVGGARKYKFEIGNLNGSAAARPARPRRGPGAGGRASEPCTAGAGEPAGAGRGRRATSRFVCVCVKLRFTVQYRRTTRLVRRAQRYGKRMATAHGPRPTPVRKADSRLTSPCTSRAHHRIRASLDLPVKSCCASSVLSSGACRVAARLLLPLRRLHAFLAGEEASSCRTPHSTARRHVR